MVRKNIISSCNGVIMANKNISTVEFDKQATNSLKEFTVTGLFGRPIDRKITFPDQLHKKAEAELLIISGPNGCGKTTVLNMIDGMLRLDFDVFRKVPFKQAVLILSNDDKMIVTRTDSEDFPLKVSCNGKKADLSKNKMESDYSSEQAGKKEEFRKIATPLFVNAIKFDLLDIHRSQAQLQNDNAEEQAIYHQMMSDPHSGRISTRARRRGPLARKVRRFVREAQLNYKKFFLAEQLELLPRIIERLENKKGLNLDKEGLINRLEILKARSTEMSRLGLQTDDDDLNTLKNYLSKKKIESTSLFALETYIEDQENRSKSRELIVTRLLSFERIMDDFLVGKKIRIDASEGLKIMSSSGTLDENSLSSGEYHFLYMMVSSLLSFRTGSIIAIDEPELSLHTSWQRKVVKALTTCAAGASPLFLFATHSSAISAEYKDKVEFFDVEET